MISFDAVTSYIIDLKNQGFTDADANVAYWNEILQTLYYENNFNTFVNALVVQMEV